MLRVTKRQNVSSHLSALMGYYVKITTDKDAKKWIIILRTLTAVILAIPLVYVLINYGFSQLNLVADIITILILIFGISIGAIGQLWRTFEDKLANSFYVRTTKGLGLDKY